MPSTDQQTENLELLLEVGRLLSSKLELSELLTTVMQLATRVVNAETASLLLVDEKTNELYFHVALGLDPALRKLRLKMGQGIAGTVAKDNKPMIINDAQHDPRWSSKMDKESGFVTKTILAAPIPLKDRCIGVVEAINSRGGEFTFTDLRVFEAFASQSAVAIENARLFNTLQEERFKLKTLLDEMQDSALLIDAEGRILLANKPAFAFFEGKTAPETLADALHSMSWTPPLSEIISLRAQDVHFEALREQPKKLILAGTASLLHDEETGEARGRVIVFRDVTEARQEEGLKRSFLSLISHKLKTPLSSITGYSQLLLDDLEKKGVPVKDFSRKSITTINTQGTKLAQLVEKLLNYTVIEEADAGETLRQPFKLDIAILEAISSLEPWLAEHKGSATLRAPSNLSALGDPMLVRDAVKNLIENGVKFAAEGRRGVELWTELNDGRAEIFVKDAGPGIPPEERERVFVKFYQVESSFTGQVEGWGLGMPFVRKVAEKFGGSVRLDSELGAGTTVVLSLPAADG